MKNNKLWFLFAICYFLFSLGLIGINLLYNIRSKEVFDIIGLIISLLILALCFKFRHKIKIPNFVFYIILIIPILLRIGLLFLNYTNIISDYEFFFSSAKNLANNQSIDTGYISLFPYLYPYVYLLGNFMKIIGDQYTTVILFNFIIDLLGGLCLYQFIALKNKQLAKIALLVWLWNPFNILWITKCCPVTIVNSLLMVTLLLFQLLKQSTNVKKAVILSVLLGISMSIANSFRPIMIIFIIALTISMIIPTHSTKYPWKKKLIAFSLILFTYIGCNFLTNQWISYQIHAPLPKNSGGWSIYVGANDTYNGKWNEVDSIYFGKLYSKYGNVKAHEIAQKEGIKRYQNLQLKSFYLLFQKSRVLGTGITTYTYFDVFDSISTTFPSIILSGIRLYLSIFWYLLLFANLFISIQIIKQKYDFNNVLKPFGLFGMGLFLATLLVEVHPRYFLPIMTILIVTILYHKSQLTINK